MRHNILAVAFLLDASSLHAQAGEVSSTSSVRRHREVGDPRSDLKRDMYALAGDEMGGREAALDEMARRGIADEMGRSGCPRGEDGSYFQWGV